MTRAQTLALLEALYRSRHGFELIGRKTAGQNGLLRDLFAGAAMELGNVLRPLGLPLGETASDADLCKVALMQTHAEAAPAPPTDSTLTVQMEPDPGEMTPSNTLVLVSGGFPKPMTWAEYILLHPAILRPHLEAIRAFWTAETRMDPERFVFVCSDGVRVGFTRRAWGDFRAALDNGSGWNPKSTYMDHYA